MDIAQFKELDLVPYRKSHPAGHRWGRKSIEGARNRHLRYLEYLKKQEEKFREAFDEYVLREIRYQTFITLKSKSQYLILKSHLEKNDKGQLEHVGKRIDLEAWYGPIKRPKPFYVQVWTPRKKGETDKGDIPQPGIQRHESFDPYEYNEDEVDRAAIFWKVQVPHDAEQIHQFEQEAQE